MPPSARSPFARAVVAMTGEAGVDLSVALLWASARVAEETDRGVVISLFGRAQLDQFYFVPPQPEEELASATEQLFWNSISDSDDPADYPRLSRRLSGRCLRPVAQDRIETLTGAPPDTDTATVEPIDVRRHHPTRRSSHRMATARRRHDRRGRGAAGRPAAARRHRPRAAAVGRPGSIQQDLFRLGLYRSGIDGRLRPRDPGGDRRLPAQPAGTGDRRADPGPASAVAVAANAVRRDSLGDAARAGRLGYPGRPARAGGHTAGASADRGTAAAGPALRRHCRQLAGRQLGFLQRPGQRVRRPPLRPEPVRPRLPGPGDHRQRPVCGLCRDPTLNVVAAAAFGATADQASGQALAACNAGTPFSDCRIRDVRCQD